MLSPVTLTCHTAVTVEVSCRNLLRSANNVANRSPLLSLLYFGPLGKHCGNAELCPWLAYRAVFFYLDKRPFVRFHAAQSIITFGSLLLLEMLVRWLAETRFGQVRHIMAFIALVMVVLWIVLMIKASRQKIKFPIAGGVAKILSLALNEGRLRASPKRTVTI